MRLQYLPWPGNFASVFFLSWLFTAACLPRPQVVQNKVASDVKLFRELDAKSAYDSSSDAAEEEANKALRNEVRNLQLRIESLEDDKRELVMAVQGVMRTNQTAVLESRLQSLADAKVSKEQRWVAKESSWKAERAGLEQNLSSSIGMVANMNDEMRDMSAAMEHAQQSVQQLNAQKNDLEKQNAGLLADKSHLIAAVREAMSPSRKDALKHMERFKAAEESWARDSADQEAVIARLRRGSNDSAQQIALLRKRQTELEEEVKNLQAEHRQAAPSKSNAPADLQSMLTLKDQQLRGALEENLMLESRDKNLTAEVDSLKRTGLKLQDDKTLLMGTIRSLTRGNSQENTALKAKIHDLQSELRDDEEELSQEAQTEEQQLPQRGSRRQPHLLKAPAAQRLRHPGAAAHASSVPLERRLKVNLSGKLASRHPIAKTAMSPAPLWDLPDGDGIADMGEALAMERYVHEAQRRRILALASAAQAPKESPHPARSQVAASSLAQADDFKELRGDISKLLKSTEGMLNQGQANEGDW